MKPVSPRLEILLPVLGFGLTQIVGYGTLYYSFSILAPDIAREFGWSADTVFLIYSAALFLGGLALQPAGQLIDRFGAARMMTLGSVLVVLMLVACALIPGRIAFIVTLTATEVVSALVLYSAAFAALVEIAPHKGQRTITYLTLIAGFASTIFWPVTTALHAAYGWREIFLIFALLNLVICVPVHAAISRRHSPKAVVPDASAVERLAPPAVEGVLRPEDRRRAFLLLAIGMSLAGITLSSVLVLMVPLLKTIGFAAEAVPVGMLFGPAQVLSRFTNMMMRSKLSPFGLALLSTGLITAGVSVLMASGPWLAAALVFAALTGFGSGLHSIVQGSLPLHLFGSRGYGALTGKLSAVRLASSALAPFLFAALMERFGVSVALASAVGCGLAGLAALIAIRPPRALEAPL